MNILKNYFNILYICMFGIYIVNIIYHQVYIKNIKRKYPQEEIIYIFKFNWFFLVINYLFALPYIIFMFIAVFEDKHYILSGIVFLIFVLILYASFNAINIYTNKRIIDKRPKIFCKYKEILLSDIASFEFGCMELKLRLKNGKYKRCLYFNNKFPEKLSKILEDLDKGE